MKIWLTLVLGILLGAFVASLMAPPSYAGNAALFGDLENWNDRSFAKLERSDKPGEFGTLTIYNGLTRITQDGRVDTIQTVDIDGVTVTFIYGQTDNLPGFSEDEVEVTDITPGYVAVPSQVLIPERETFVIRIIEYSGM